MVLKILEWTVLVVAIAHSISWAWSIRRAYLNGGTPTPQVTMMGMCWAGFILSVLLGRLSPLHLLWMYPLGAVLALFGPFVPLFRYVLFFLTGIYLWLCLFGLRRNQVPGLTE